MSSRAFHGAGPDRRARCGAAASDTPAIGGDQPGKGPQEERRDVRIRQVAAVEVVKPFPLSRRMRLLLLFVLVGLQACSSLEPAGGDSSTFTYSPYAAPGQPSLERVTLAPQIADVPQIGTSGSGQSAAYEHLPRPVMENLVGPGRVCRGGLRVEVLAGERAVISNASIWIQGGGVDLLLEAWIYELPRDEAFLRSAGFVTLPGMGEVERIEITRPHPTGPRYSYVIDARRVPTFGRWGVSSTRFEGTVADLAALARIAVDDAGGC